MTKKFTLKTAAILFTFLLVLFFGMRYFRYSSAARTSVSSPGSPIVIETDHVKELSPHHHAPGDSVSDDWHHTTVYSPVYTAPRDLYISQIRFEYFNAPSSTVHHTSFADVSSDNTTCPNMDHWNELFSWASDRMFNNVIGFPKGYALKIKKGTPLQLYLMVHNPEPPLGEGGDYHDVYTRISLTETSEDPKTIHLVKPHLLHLDDEGCVWKKPDRSDSLIFTVPPESPKYVYSGKGKTDAASSFQFKKAGTVLDLTGHLHPWQGGQNVTVYRNDEAIHVFKSGLSEAVPYWYVLPVSKELYHVNAGDRIWISAEYDNPYKVHVRGAMGMAGFYYTEDQ